MTMTGTVSGPEALADNYNHVHRWPTGFPPLGNHATLSSTQVLRFAGLPYRFLHRAVHEGLVRPLVPPRGSGSQMSWNARDVRLLLALDALSTDVGGRKLRTFLPLLVAELGANPRADAITIEHDRVAVTLRIASRGQR